MVTTVLDIVGIVAIALGAALVPVALVPGLLGPAVGVLLFGLIISGFSLMLAMTRKRAVAGRPASPRRERQRP